jgi:hypothetical protein
MLFNPSQHLKMAAFLHKKTKAQRDPEIKEKQAAMAEVFRMLARKAGDKQPAIGDDRRTGSVRSR